MNETSAMPPRTSNDMTVSIGRSSIEMWDELDQLKASMSAWRSCADASSTPIPDVDPSVPLADQAALVHQCGAHPWELKAIRLSESGNVPM